MSEGPNAGQIAYWNDTAGRTWAEMQAPLDRQLSPLGLHAISVLAPRPGERILDIGCGAGDTSLHLARSVGESGQVTGVDISRPLLDIARGRSTGQPGVGFVEGDAQTYPFEAASFDAAFSRFGVMFFADPPAAFANIRRALKPGGRLAFLCWRSMAENPILTTPMAAAGHLLPPLPPAEPGAPGPFAFADPERVRGILQAAGFENIALTPHDEKIGGGDLDTSVGLALRIGPLGALVRENMDKRDAVVAAIREEMAKHLGPDGVKLASATWVVTARAP